MRRLDIVYPFRTRLLGHIDVDDHKIWLTIDFRMVNLAEAYTISRLAQPLSQQSTREIVFLVYYDVQSIEILRPLRHLWCNRASGV